jgi:RimJ/RimL family protein N-acetyltransferase
MAKVTLRPIRISDAQACFRWVLDPDVIRYLGLVQPVGSLEQERAWISRALTDKQQRIFVIEDESGRPIGTCGLRGIEPDAGTAFLGIMIGEKSCWDQGYGTAAVRALVEHGFTELGLREIRLSCHPENHRAIRCYRKVGFEPSEHELHPRRFGCREVRMSITRERWQEVRSEPEQ